VQGKRTSTGSGLIQVSEGTEKNAAVKNEPSLSEEQQRAASPSDYEENKRNARVCQGRRGPFCAWLTSRMLLSSLAVAASSCTSFHCGVTDVMRNGTATIGAVVRENRGFWKG